MSDYQQRLQQSIDYMEARLGEEVSLADCAQAAGYSPYYYSRLFHLTTGVMVADYLRKRRLSQAAIALVQSSRSITNICFDYGFNSPENFTRAFQREHAVTPSAYRRTRSSLCLLQPRNIAAQSPEQAQVAPKPRFVVKPAFLLVGYSIRTSKRGNRQQQTAPQLWNRYHAERLADTIPHGKPAEQRYDIGMLIDFGLEDSSFTYMVGVEMPVGTRVKPPLTAQEIPMMEYAVFATPPADKHTFVNTIHRTWGAIYQQWLPNAGVEHAGTHEFETYCEASESYSEDIYIPIIRRQ